MTETPRTQADERQAALAALIGRIERFVDHECSDEHRYAFLQEVRVLAGPVAIEAEAATLDVERTGPGACRRVVPRRSSGRRGVEIRRAAAIAREYRDGGAA